MNTLDEALVNLRQDMDDPKKQSAFYDLFLNSTFFVPILHDREPVNEAAAADGAREVLPVITEAGGNDYLMLFDTLDRMKDWSKKDLKEDDEEEVRYVEVAGHLLALTTTAPLHWAMNAGTEYSKQFFPEEIAWLRDAVERCNAEAASQEAVK